MWDAQHRDGCPGSPSATLEARVDLLALAVESSASLSAARVRDVTTDFHGRLSLLLVQLGQVSTDVDAATAAQASPRMQALSR